MGDRTTGDPGVWWGSDEEVGVWWGVGRLGVMGRVGGRKTGGSESGGGVGRRGRRSGGGSDD